MSVVLLSGDLMVLSRVDAAASRNGIAIRSASSAAQAVNAGDAEPIELLIIDLATPQLETAGLVREIQSKVAGTTRIIAFGPHVHEERLAAAHEAGCDEVFSRGQFFAQVDTILLRHVARQSDT
jgi:DNA-binding response OmpR family regulator